MSTGGRQSAADDTADLPGTQRPTWPFYESSRSARARVEVAGRTVAAAFVGAVAGGLVIAEATRYLAGEHRYAVIDASLRDLAARLAVEAVDPPPARNLGFSRLG